MNKTIASAPEPIKFILNCLYASVFGVIMLLCLSAVSAVFLGYTDTPENFYTACAVALKIVCSLSAGIIATRKNRHSSLFCGILTSFGIIGMMTVFSLFLPAEIRSDGAWWQAVIIPICAIIGSIFANSK